MFGDLRNDWIRALLAVGGVALVLLHPSAAIANWSFDQLIHCEGTITA
jgi:hypothetical protein